MLLAPGRRRMSVTNRKPPGGRIQKQKQKLTRWKRKLMTAFNSMTNRSLYSPLQLAKVTKCKTSTRFSLFDDTG